MKTETKTGEWTNKMPEGWDKGVVLQVNLSEQPNRVFEAKRLPDGSAWTERCRFGWIYEYAEGDRTVPYNGRTPYAVYNEL